MAGQIETRLRDLGIELPAPAAPVANYRATARCANLLFVAGQLPRWDGGLRFVGKLGREFGVEEGQKAARLCALNVIGHLRDATNGDLDSVRRCLRIGGFVNSLPEFADQHLVLDGASDLLVQVFGESGRHARTSVGVSALPHEAAVEIEATFEIG